MSLWQGWQRHHGEDSGSEYRGDVERSGEVRGVAVAGVRRNWALKGGDNECCIALAISGRLKAALRHHWHGG